MSFTESELAIPPTPLTLGNVDLHPTHPYNPRPEGCGGRERGQPLVPETGTEPPDADDLPGAADQALYQAKDEGRNRVSVL